MPALDASSQHCFSCIHFCGCLGAQTDPVGLVFAGVAGPCLPERTNNGEFPASERRLCASWAPGTPWQRRVPLGLTSKKTLDILETLRTSSAESARGPGALPEIGVDLSGGMKPQLSYQMPNCKAKIGPGPRSRTTSCAAFSSRLLHSKKKLLLNITPD